MSTTGFENRRGNEINLVQNVCNNFGHQQTTVGQLSVLTLKAMKNRALRRSEKRQISSPSKSYSPEQTTPSPSFC